MAEPIRFRCYIGFSLVRLTVHEDRVVREARDPIVGLSAADRTVLLDDVALVYRFRRPVHIHLLWLLFTAPLAGISLLVLQGSSPSPIFAGVAALLLALTLFAGFRRRPHVKLRDRAGGEILLRMDQPLLRPGLRREIRRRLSEGIGVEL